MRQKVATITRKARKTNENPQREISQLERYQKALVAAAYQYNREVNAVKAPPGSMVWDREMRALYKRWHVRPPYDVAAVDRGVAETVGRMYDMSHGGF